MPRPGPTQKPAVFLVLSLFLTAPLQAADLDKTLESIIQANMAAAASQGRVDVMSDKTTEMLVQYRAIQEQIASVKAYNTQVKTLVDAQLTEVASLEKQIDNATSIGREITPLMLRMLEALEAFIDLDTPFLISERHRRVQDLRSMMDRADVADSEKFRRLLEAYQVENEYGRTIEAYKGDLAEEGQSRTVNYLRVGRIALLYLSLDEKDAGVWNKVTKRWEHLPMEYRNSVKLGLRIARKQVAPDLIRLPIMPAEDVQ